MDYSVLFFLLILAQTMSLHHHCNSDVYTYTHQLAVWLTFSNSLHYNIASLITVPSSGMILDNNWTLSTLPNLTLQPPQQIAKPQLC